MILIILYKHWYDNIVIRTVLACLTGFTISPIFYLMESWCHLSITFGLSCFGSVCSCFSAILFTYWLEIGSVTQGLHDIFFHIAICSCVILAPLVSCYHIHTFINWVMMYQLLIHSSWNKRWGTGNENNVYVLYDNNIDKHRKKHSMQAGWDSVGW